MTRHDCPDCRCWTPEDDAPVQPATSSAWARKAALQAAEAAIRAAKDARTGKRGGNETTGGGE